MNFMSMPTKCKMKNNTSIKVKTGRRFGTFAFACLKCKQMHTIASKDHEIYCTTCGKRNLFGNRFYRKQRFDDTLIAIKKLKDILIDYLSNLKADEVVSTDPVCFGIRLRTQNQNRSLRRPLTNKGIKFVFKRSKILFLRRNPAIIHPRQA